MARGYAKDLRARAVAMVEEGESRREIARHAQARSPDWPLFIALQSFINHALIRVPGYSMNNKDSAAPRAGAEGV
jgi:hypothetical protein